MWRRWIGVPRFAFGANAEVTVPLKGTLDLNQRDFNEDKEECGAVRASRRKEYSPWRCASVKTRQLKRHAYCLVVSGQGQWCAMTNYADFDLNSGHQRTLSPREQEVLNWWFADFRIKRWPADSNCQRGR